MVIMAQNKARLTDDQKLRFGFPVDREYARIFQPRIIVIGAGAAGLAAAQRLADNEFTDIVILEAQDRIGGRVWSQEIGIYLKFRFPWDADLTRVSIHLFCVFELNLIVFFFLQRTGTWKWARSSFTERMFCMMWPNKIN